MSQALSVDHTVAPSQGRVLLADDDLFVLKAYGRLLERAGFAVQMVSEGKIALEMLQNEDFDLIVSDISMPDLDGLSLLKAARQRDPDMPVILMTGGPTVESAVQALEHGALRYLMKPVDATALRASVKEATRLREIARVHRDAFELYGRVANESKHRAELEARFNSALETLWMAFQPVIRWSQQSAYAYESLVRTREPTLCRPDDFIATAEGLDKLPILGRTIRDRVAEAIPSAPGDALIFVNLHPEDLKDSMLFSASSAMSQHASRIVLELTERASLDGFPEVRSRLATLRKLGYRIALDDLGAGYAGLSSFAHLQPEIVKLDMSLVRDIDKEPTKRKLVRSLNSLCAELGIQVVAEGVETVEERDTLIDLGCDLLQGFLFARPTASFSY